MSALSKMFHLQYSRYFLSMWQSRGRPCINEPSYCPTKFYLFMATKYLYKVNGLLSNLQLTYQIANLRAQFGSFISGKLISLMILEAYLR